MGRDLQVQLGEDELLYLDESGVAAFLEDLPDAEFEGWSGGKACKMVNLAFSMRLRVAALRTDQEPQQSQLTHVVNEGGADTFGISEINPCSHLA